jgi:hypothetical protein
MDPGKKYGTPKIHDVTHCLTTGIPKDETWDIENNIYNHLAENDCEFTGKLDPHKCEPLNGDKGSSLFIL